MKTLLIATIVIGISLTGITGAMACKGPEIDWDDVRRPTFPIAPQPGIPPGYGPGVAYDINTTKGVNNEKTNLSSFNTFFVQPDRM
jgi:hypothetical protein